MQNDEYMSRRNTTTPEATQREALINGTAKEHREKRSGSADFVCITERHGQRLLRLARISQVIMDGGQIGGPWFVRCDGQQLAVSEENARLIMDRLGLSMGDGKCRMSNVECRMTNV